MKRSRGLGRLITPRRIPVTLGMAVGTAFAAALIGLANAPVATADTDLDPFQDLFGNTGINTWTPSADSFLNSIDPTNALAGNFDTSVDGFQTGGSSLFPDDPFTLLTLDFDPSAFTFDPSTGLVPDNAIGDLAVGLDYTVVASLGPGVVVYLDELLNELLNALGVSLGGF